MDELAKRFADLAEKYGPNVADAAMSAARVEAYSVLASGIISIISGIALIYAAIFISRKAKANEDNDMKVLIYAGAIAVGAIAMIPLYSGIWAWIDPWTWTTISHPELWIAKKAFHI